MSSPNAKHLQIVLKLGHGNSTCKHARNGIPFSL